MDAATSGDQLEPDVRIRFVGDSYVAGVGDPSHLGWVGRLAAYSHSKGHPLTAYNLGVRSDTSADVLRRFQAECGPRLPNENHAGVVLSFGVNDMALESRGPRVAKDDTTANLRGLLREANSKGWPVMVIGPPAVHDRQHNERIVDLDAALAQECLNHSLPYVSVVRQLQSNEVWQSEIRNGDGAHPADRGYEILATLLRPSWTAWLADLRTAQSQAKQAIEAAGHSQS